MLLTDSDALFHISLAKDPGLGYRINMTVGHFSLAKVLYHINDCRSIFVPANLADFSDHLIFFEHSYINDK